MEYMFRVQDYLFSQLIYAATDTDPYKYLRLKAKNQFMSSSLTPDYFN
jgi:hypothetical protein